MTNDKSERRTGTKESTTPRATLRKSEILHGYRSFTSVISSGKTLVVRPVRLFYTVDRSAPVGLQIGFTSARGLRGAVRRNRSKRLLRESFRLQRDILFLDSPPWTGMVKIVLMYVGPVPEKATQLRLEEVKPAVEEVLRRLSGELRREP